MSIISPVIYDDANIVLQAAGLVENMKNRRICIGTTEICGIMMKLSHAFSSMDIVNECFCMNENANFTDGNDEYYNPRLKRFYYLSWKIKQNYLNGKKIAARLWQIAEMFEIILLFIYTLRKFDAYIFIFARSFFSGNPYLNRVIGLEYFLLKCFRKSVVVIYCGSDSRPPYCGKYEKSLAELAKTVKKMADHVHIVERSAIVIDNPASAYFHRKPYISYNFIGNLVEEDEFVKRKKGYSESSKIKILHAPSSASYKGTDVIRNAVKKLLDDGYEIVYKELSGVPHSVIVEELKNCDILVNELYSDFPMSMLDTEAALNGIPVVTCGYYAEYYKSEMPGPIPPTCYCLPEQMEEILADLITNPKKRIAIGRNEQEFVRSNWMAKDVAKKILRLFDADIPDNWLYDPKRSVYLWGAAVNKKRTMEMVCYLIKNHGMKSLQLEKGSRLYKAYYELYKKRKNNNE